MILWDLPAGFVLTCLFILGCCVGSFLNVCIHRLPQHESVWQAWRGLWSPPSSCPKCQTRILAIDNVPLLGWLWLRGRCRACRNKISIRYPLVELLNGCLWVLLYVALVPLGWNASVVESAGFSALGPLPAAGWTRGSYSFWLHLRFLYDLVLVEALVVATFIDFDLQIIPDSVTLPAMAVGVLGSLTGMLYLVPVWFQDPQLLGTLWRVFVADTSPPWWWQTSIPVWTRQWPMLHGLAVSLAGLIIGGGIVWFVRLVGAWVFRREAMGFGDVILLAMIGSFIGWQPAAIVFFFAPMCALVVVVGLLIASWVTRDSARQREIPFGPYLSLATLIVLLGWPSIGQGAERFFALGPLFPLLAALLAGLLVTVLWMVQGLKWLLGIPLFEEEWSAEWTAADQLAFFASKDGDSHSRPLQRTEWPGEAAGRGRLHRDQWRGG